LNFGGPHDLVAEIATEVARRAQVNTPTTKQLRELSLNTGKSQEPWLLAPLELDEEIYVAIGSVGPFQDRSEYGQATDVMPAAKRSKLPRVLKQAICHRGLSSRKKTGGIHEVPCRK
jgi:hypothetical protein